MTTGQLYPVDGLPGINFEDGSTTDTYLTGTQIDTNKGTIIWAKAASSISEGDICHLSTSAGVTSATASTTALVSTTRLDIVVAHKAVANGAYGWFFAGPFVDVQVRLAASVNADTAITTTTNAGIGGTGGTAISGLTTNAASGAGGLTSCRSPRPMSVGTGA